MANPEHIAIVRAGKKAIDEWRKKHFRLDEIHHMDLTNAQLLKLRLENVDVRHADLGGSNLEDSCFVRVNLSYANLRQANLKGVKLIDSKLVYAKMNQANLVGISISNTNLDYANLAYANLERATISESSLCSGSLKNSNLAHASIFSSDFTNAYCKCADFRNTDIYKTFFFGTKLKGAILTGIHMHAIETEGWDIKNVKCDYFFWVEGHGKKSVHKRIPREGYLCSGAFVDRFKSRPTIEFCFKYGMGGLDPLALTAAIDQANLQNQKAGLRLLDITARGGLPRAIIEIAERASREDALALVTSCYQQKTEQMKKEIEGLKTDKKSLLQIASRKMLLPAMGSTDSFMSATDLAKYYEVDSESLRKRLDRYRAKHTLDTDFFIESQDRGTRKPRYVYNLKMVAPIAQELKDKKASVKHPSGKIQK